MGFQPILHLDEGVIYLGKGHPAFVQLAGKPVMAVAVELEPKGSPGRNPQIAKAEFLVDEVEVVVQALGVFVTKLRMAGLFVVSRHECTARFHGREDMHEAWMVSPLLEDLLNAVLLAEIMDGTYGTQK